MCAKNVIKMAENKKSVLLYCDLIHTVEKLTNSQAGKLFKHYLRYINDQNPIADEVLIDLVFEPIKQNLKRDLKKWEKIREKRSDAGKASAKKRKQKQQVLTSVESVEQTSTNPTVNVTVNDNVNVITINSYIKEISKSPTYLEGIYRTFKLEQGSIAILLNNFKEHLKMYPKEYNNFSEFKKHFNNWLHTLNNKNSLSKYQKQSKGSL